MTRKAEATDYRAHPRRYHAPQQALPACATIAAVTTPTPYVAKPSVGSALHAAKRELRLRILAERDALRPEERDHAARVITARILALPSFVAARTVLLTLAYGSEWDTLPLLNAALAAGKTVVLPRVDLATRMLELRSILDPVADVEYGHRDIREPMLRCPLLQPTAIDWVLVPGVAFDLTGRRLGYGGGYYDRLLPLLVPDTPLVAGAFDLQLVSNVPVGTHDLAVQLIVTESTTIPATRG